MLSNALANVLGQFMVGAELQLRPFGRGVQIMHILPPITAVDGYYAQLTVLVIDPAPHDLPLDRAGMSA
jgi:hypothetical protein